MADEPIESPPTTTIEPEAEAAAAPPPPTKKESAPSSSSSSSGGGACCAKYKALFEPLEQNPICAQIKEILLWHKIITTLVAFLGMNAFFLLILYAGFSTTTLISLAALFAVIVSFLYGQVPVLYSRYVAHKEMESPLAGKSIAIPKETISGLAQALGDLVNALLGVFSNILFAEELPVTICAIFGFGFLAWLGTRVRITTLAYVLCIFGFIWPRLYAEQQATIDKLCDAGRAQVMALYDKLAALIKEKLEGAKAKAA